MLVIVKFFSKSFLFRLSIRAELKVKVAHAHVEVKLLLYDLPGVQHELIWTGGSSWIFQYRTCLLCLLFQLCHRPKKEIRKELVGKMSNSN